MAFTDMFYRTAINYDGLLLKEHVPRTQVNLELVWSIMLKAH